MENSEGRPDSVQAAKRLLILKHIAAFSREAPPRHHVESWFSQWSRRQMEDYAAKAEKRREEFWSKKRLAPIRDEMSRSEKIFSLKNFVVIDEQEQIDGTWGVESAHVLMWALRLVKNLKPFDTMAEFATFAKVAKNSDDASFIAAAKLRDSASIDRARNIAEFWHWRCRTWELVQNGANLHVSMQRAAGGVVTYDDIVRRAAKRGQEDGLFSKCIDEDFPAKGKAFRDLSEDEWHEVRSICSERHKALNWLCGYAPGNRWDETPTDT